MDVFTRTDFSPEPADEFPMVKDDLETKGYEDSQMGSGVFSPDLADASNYIQTAKYLSSALAAGGFPNPIRIESASVEDKVQIVNCIFTLLVERQKVAENLKEARDSLETLRIDYAHAKNRINELSEEAKTAKQNASEIESRRRYQEKEFRQEEAQRKQMIAELEKKNIMILHRDNQYKHELRKREKENRALQEKLAKYIEKGGSYRESDRESRIVIEILNPSRASHLSTLTRPKHKSSVGEMGLLQSQIEGYDKKLNELLKENGALRDTLSNIQLFLQDLDESSFQDSTSITHLLRAHDYNAVRDRIEARLKASIQSLKFKLSSPARIAHSSSCGDEAGLDESRRIEYLVKIQEQETEIEKLNREIAEQKKLLLDQDEMLQSKLFNEGPSLEPDPELQRRWSIVEDLEEERRHFAEKQETAENKIRLLEDELKALQEERKELEREKILLRQGGHALPSAAPLPLAPATITPYTSQYYSSHATHMQIPQHIPMSTSLPQLPTEVSDGRSSKQFSNGGGQSVHLNRNSPTPVPWAARPVADSGTTDLSVLPRSSTTNGRGGGSLIDGRGPTFPKPIIKQPTRKNVSPPTQADTQQHATKVSQTVKPVTTQQIGPPKRATGPHPFPRLGPLNESSYYQNSSSLVGPQAAKNTPGSKAIMQPTKSRSQEQKETTRIVKKINFDPSPRGQAPLLPRASPATFQSKPRPTLPTSHLYT